jgi:hypothetical protein
MDLEQALAAIALFTDKQLFMVTAFTQESHDSIDVVFMNPVSINRALNYID